MSDRINLPVFIGCVPNYSFEDGMFYVRCKLADGQEIISVFKPSTFIEANTAANRAIEEFYERKAPVYLSVKR